VPGGLVPVAASVSTPARPKDPARVAAGRASIRKRWGPPRILRLDHLDPAAADVIRAAWQAADNAANRQADPVVETLGSAQATEGPSDGTSVA
jgi:hypothetical protein